MRMQCIFYIFFFSSRRRHTRSKRDWSSDVCSSDLRCEGSGGNQAGKHERADVIRRAATACGADGRRERECPGIRVHIVEDPDGVHRSKADVEAVAFEEKVTADVVVGPEAQTAE